MVARNTLFQAPPFAVEQALRKLGTNLRIARLRRKQTIEQVAEKIGTGKRAIMAAERGNPFSLIAVYGALLWTYGLLGPFENLRQMVRNRACGGCLGNGCGNDSWGIPVSRCFLRPH